MTMKDQGGQAFPNYERYSDGSGGCHGGMSLRDYFAARAMQGLLSNSALIDELGSEGSTWITSRAFKLADQMLAEREKQ